MTHYRKNPKTAADLAYIRDTVGRVAKGDGTAAALWSLNHASAHDVHLIATTMRSLEGALDATIDLDVGH